MVFNHLLDRLEHTLGELVLLPAGILPFLASVGLPPVGLGILPSVGLGILPSVGLQEIDDLSYGAVAERSGKSVSGAGGAGKGI